MDNLSFNQIKCRHEELISQYLLLINHVRNKYKHAFLRILVEGHIKKRLLELSVDYFLIGFNPKIEDRSIKHWLHQTSENCENLAGVLISVSDPLLKPIQFFKEFGGILIKLVIFFLGLGLLGLNNTVLWLIGLGEVELDIQEILPEFLIRNIHGEFYSPNEILFLISLFLFFIIGIFGNSIVNVLNNKYLLFSNHISRKAPAHPDNLNDVYSLENDLFYLLGKRKKIEVPVDLIFTLTTQITITLLQMLVVKDEYPVLFIILSVGMIPITIIAILRWKDRLSNLLV